MGIDGSLLKKRGLSDAKVELGFAHFQEAVYIKKERATISIRGE